MRTKSTPDTASTKMTPTLLRTRRTSTPSKDHFMSSPSRASSSAHRTLPAWWANTTKHPAQLNIPFGMVLDKPARADSELCGVVHDRLIDSKLKANAQSAHALAS